MGAAGMRCGRALAGKRGRPVITLSDVLQLTSDEMKKQGETLSDDRASSEDIAWAKGYLAALRKIRSAILDSAMGQPEQGTDQ